MHGIIIVFGVIAIWLAVIVAANLDSSNEERRRKYLPLDEQERLESDDQKWRQGYSL